MLEAPDCALASTYYCEVLGFRQIQLTDEELVVEGYGMQVVVSRGEGDQLLAAPDRSDAALEINVPMLRMEQVWERDRGDRPGVAGPVLCGNGHFSYVTLDPGGNAVVLTTPLPTIVEGLPEKSEGTENHSTKRLRPLDV